MNLYMPGHPWAVNGHVRNAPPLSWVAAPQHDPDAGQWVVRYSRGAMNRRNPDAQYFSTRKAAQTFYGYLLALNPPSDPPAHHVVRPRKPMSPARAKRFAARIEQITPPVRHRSGVGWVVRWRSKGKQPTGRRFFNLLEAQTFYDQIINAATEEMSAR